MNTCEQLCSATAAREQCDDIKDAARCVLFLIVARRLWAVVSKHLEGEQHSEQQPLATGTF